MNLFQKAIWRSGLTLGKSLRGCGFHLANAGWWIEDKAAAYFSRCANRDVSKILAMSDEDILAIVPPDEIERTRQLLAAVATGDTK